MKHIAGKHRFGGDNDKLSNRNSNGTRNAAAIIIMAVIVVVFIIISPFIFDNRVASLRFGVLVACVMGLVALGMLVAGVIKHKEFDWSLLIFMVLMIVMSVVYIYYTSNITI